MIQVGSNGQQGIRVGTYEETSDPNCVVGYVEPSCEKPGWILWFTKQGDAIFHREREDGGGVIDEPIRVKGKQQP